MPIVNSHYNIIYNNPSDRIFKQRDYFGPVNIEKLHIRLLDRFGDPIDMVNTDYSLAIELTCLYWLLKENTLNIFSIFIV